MNFNPVPQEEDKAELLRKWVERWAWPQLAQSQTTG